MRVSRRALVMGAGTAVTVGTTFRPSRSFAEPEIKEYRFVAKTATVSLTGDGQPDMPPLLTLKRGQTCVLALRNDTAWWHPMHLHGHSFRVISRNGRPNPLREWRDTVLMPAHENAKIAFVADNPGDWMLHCHVTDHQEAGMMSVIRIA